MCLLISLFTQKNKKFSGSLLKFIDKFHIEILSLYLVSQKTFSSKFFLFLLLQKCFQILIIFFLSILFILNKPLG